MTAHEKRERRKYILRLILVSMSISFWAHVIVGALNT